MGSTSSTKLLFFRVDLKTKMAVLTSDWLRHFQLFLWNMELDKDKNEVLNVLFQFCDFWADRNTKINALADTLERWHIVLGYTVCCTLGPLLIVVFTHVKEGKW